MNDYPTCRTCGNGIVPDGEGPSYYCDDCRAIEQLQEEVGCVCQEPESEPEPDPAAAFGYLMGEYEAMWCHDCYGWTVYWTDDDNRDQIAYSSCKHDEVCPDCRRTCEGYCQ